MTQNAREVIKGAVGGVCFLVSVVALDLPWVVAGLVAGAVYVGMCLLLPKPSTIDRPQVPPGLSLEEYGKFLETCRRCVTELVGLQPQIQDTDFQPQVRRLTDVARNLLSCFEKKPDSVLLMATVPENLDHLVRMLRHYAELSRFPQPGRTVEEALGSVRKTIETSTSALQAVYQQLLTEDVAALKASARTLEILMGVDADLAALRESDAATTVSHQSQSLPARPAPQRQRER